MCGCWEPSLCHLLTAPAGTHCLSPPSLFLCSEWYPLCGLCKEEMRREIWRAWPECNLAARVILRATRSSHERADHVGLTPWPRSGRILPWAVCYRGPHFQSSSGLALLTIKGTLPPRSHASFSSALAACLGPGLPRETVSTLYPLPVGTIPHLPSWGGLRSPR